MSCDFLAGNNNPDLPYLQGGMKFATQISPLLNYYFFNLVASDGLYFIKHFTRLYDLSCPNSKPAGSLNFPSSFTTTTPTLTEIFYTLQNLRLGKIQSQ